MEEKGKPPCGDARELSREEARRQQQRLLALLEAERPLGTGEPDADDATLATFILPGD